MIKVLCKWTNFLCNITLFILLDKMDQVWVACCLLVWTSLTLWNIIHSPKLFNLIFCNILYYQVFCLSYFCVSHQTTCALNNYLIRLYFNWIFTYWIWFHPFLYFVCFNFSDIFLELFHIFCYLFCFVLTFQTCFGFGFMHFCFVFCLFVCLFVCFCFGCSNMLWIWLNAFLFYFG